MAMAMASAMGIRKCWGLWCPVSGNRSQRLFCLVLIRELCLPLDYGISLACFGAVDHGDIELV